MDMFFIKATIFGRTTIKLYTDKEKFWQDFNTWTNLQAQKDFKMEFGVLKDSTQIQLEGYTEISDSCIAQRFF